MSPYDLIIRPLVTEKSTALREQANKVCFVVRQEANRSQIKSAVEEVLKVKVEKVHVFNMIGKTKRLNRFEGKRSDWKKAIVTLKKGEKLDLFEG